MNPALKPLLIFGMFVLWILPFFRFRPRGQEKEKAVRMNPVARWGIGLQSIGYLLVYLHGPATWNQPLAAWRLCLGALLAIAGIVLAWQAMRMLGRQWRIDAGLNADHELVRGGPYRLIRHPIYASMFCTLLAGIAWVGTLPGAPLALLFFVAGIEIRIRVEDNLLRERFGGQFTEWSSRVPAWLPFLR